jgi:hypothetical protein
LPHARGLRAARDRCALVLHRFSASGRASGLHTEQIRADGAALFQISEGKVVRLVHYFDRGHALADLDPGAHAAGS